MLPTIIGVLVFVVLVVLFAAAIILDERDKRRAKREGRELGPSPGIIGHWERILKGEEDPF